MGLFSSIANRPKLWVGIPQAVGAFPKEAKRVGYPVMISASRFWVKSSKGHWYFRKPSALVRSMPVFLDSAGFTAMVNWKHFPWRPEQYLDLIEAGNWTHWSSMDLCCEKQIAPDRRTVRYRVEQTAAYLKRLYEGAMRRALSLPLPILQGWFADDYEYSAALTDRVLRGKWPALVGVGSVCRRHSGGPDGLIQIVARLNRILPDGVGLHLFGVKGDALPKLSHCPRVVSVDSMAWDSRARNALQARRRELVSKTGITMKEANKRLPSLTVDRIPVMHQWVRDQKEYVR